MARLGFDSKETRWKILFLQISEKDKRLFFNISHLGRLKIRICVPDAICRRRESERCQKEMQIWTREEFQRFIDAVDNPLYHALFTFMFFTGRREGEILALSPADINLKAGTATFNKSITYYKTSNGEPWEIVPTKAYKEQTLPLAKPVIDELKNFEMGEIFLFGGERPMPTTTVTRYFQKYTEKAGLKRIRIHDLRHSFVSMLIHNGVNLAVVADLISDTLEQVTKTYAHMYSSDREEAIKTLI